MNKKIIPRFISIKTAQKMYSISRCKLLDLIYSRKIIASKKLGKWLIKTDSLESYLLEDFNNLENKVENLLQGMI